MTPNSGTYTEQRANGAQSIYFIQAGGDGPVKIGRAANIRARLSNIQTGCPEPVRVIGALWGDAGAEKALHTKFRTCRLRGEWFKPHDRLLRYIVKEARGDLYLWATGQRATQPKPPQEEKAARDRQALRDAIERRRQATALSTYPEQPLMGE